MILNQGAIIFSTHYISVKILNANHLKKRRYLKKIPPGIKKPTKQDG